jgi:hypothetical protein
MPTLGELIESAKAHNDNTKVGDLLERIERTITAGTKIAITQGATGETRQFPVDMSRIREPDAN